MRTPLPFFSPRHQLQHQGVSPGDQVEGGGDERPASPASVRAIFPLHGFSSFFPYSFFSPSLSLLFIQSLFLSLIHSSPHLGPTVIGIPSGSWDPYKHSRQRERARARQSVCEEEKDMQAERKRKPASQYAGSLEH